MNTGYTWPVALTRTSLGGKCETLRMELTLAIYADTKDILVYFCETDISTISKCYKRIECIFCYLLLLLDKDRNLWHVELGLSQKKLGFLSEKEHRLFIVSFHAVSEAYDCVSILRLFQYRVDVHDSVTLPSVLPAPNTTLPSIPTQIADSADVESDSTLSVDMSHLNDNELSELIGKIRSKPEYNSILQRVRNLMS